jgi:hypothetical protein
MAHARTQIRDAVVTILENATVADTVSKSRVYPIPANTVSMALVYTNSETVLETTLTYPRKFNRELTLSIDCVARDSDYLDDRLDRLCEAVENAIGADNTLGGVVKDCVLSDTQITLDFSGDAPIGSAKMQFRVMYRTAETNAGTIIS